MLGSGGQRGKLGEVRIIGGRWRGRKLTFQAADGLRPTGDRIRETLFNWLATHIHGAHCLDLFAGSGALGLEALSRGAAFCDFVDTSRIAMRQVSQHLHSLGASELGHCHLSPALQYLQAATRRYQIVFVDPPFNLQIAGPVCAALAQQRLLDENALVYLEMAALEPMPAIPPGWVLHRDKRAGAVAYRLFTVRATTQAT